MNFLKKLPLPLAGTALGFAALGNVLASYHPMLKTGAGLISAVLVVLLTLKIIALPKPCREAMANPVVAGTMATYPMAIMILSTYLPKGTAAVSLWGLGLLLHATLILWFTNQFILKGFDMKKVFPTWFIVFVGIVSATVSAPYHNQKPIGMAAFWFGLITYLLLLAVVTYRTVKLGQLPEPALPTLAIYAAPASLLLAGYMNSADNKSLPLVYFLLALSVLLFLAALVMLPRLLKLPFYPSYSAFTFPFVISALAEKLTNGFLIKSGHALPLLNGLVLFQVILASALCLYVLGRFIQFLAVPAVLTEKSPVK